MKKQIANIIFLSLFALFAATSCYSILESNQVADNSENPIQYAGLSDTLRSLIMLQDSDTAMILQHTGCYGTCPIFSLALLSNGKIYFEGKKFVNEIGIRDTVFNTNKLKKIMSGVEKAGFYDLKGSYNLKNCSGYTDSPNIIITIKNKKNQKRVSFYTGCIDYKDEREIINLTAEKIEKLSGISSWIN